MTFSDAEDDQPSSLQNRDGVTDNNLNQQSDDANEAGAVGGDEASVQSYQSSENSESNISTDFIAVAPLSIINGLVPDTNGNNNAKENEASEVNDDQLVEIQSETTERLEPPTSAGCPLDLPRLPADVQETLPNEASGCESLENVDLETEKINEKLLQIQGYILQTTNAMHSLENEGNMDNIGKYDTLVKVMRDLKSSESKLIAHLNVLKEKSSKQGGPDEGAGSTDQPKESGSESLGVVGSFNDGDGPRSSLHERLNHHQHEQEILSARLRESLVRRQELMTRYQATRVRLDNLKRKRYGIAHEERQLLQSVGANETPYENPIPEADSWTIEQLESAVQDFIALREKVDRVHQAYLARLEAVEDDDTTTPIELHAKIEQVLNKRLQIVSALSQMREFLRVKRDGGAVVEENVDSNQLHSEENHNANGESQISEASVGTISINEELSRPLPSEDITPAQGPEEELFNRDITEGAQALSDEVLELQAKQNHLQSLKNQLNAMKLLLQVTRGVPVTSDSENDHPVLESGAHIEIGASPNLLVDPALENNDSIVGETIVGLKGSVIHLSESERRDPLVVSKYMQLNHAKERLARMEEVMKLISEAGDKGLPLDQVLSSEDMDILTQAREDDDLSLVSPVNILEDHHLLESLRNSEIRLQEQQLQKENKSNPQPIRNQVNEMQDRQTNSSTAEWEREKEISAMHFHLNKKTPGIPSVNDGSRIEHEKGALKKQARNLFCEGGNDPRVNELFTLQEELKEKKNALEALMKKMGKSSSFMLDNFSDNISENVSDCNSETLERPTASWGTGQGGFFTDLYQSEDEIIHVANDEVPILNSLPSVGMASGSHQATEGLPPSNFQQNGPQKNHNTLNPSAPKTQINSGNPQFSVNNLNNPRSVRPKRNQPSTGGGHSIGVWENMNGVNSNVFQQNSNTKVQNTVSSALAQLSQVQDTINSLYEDLRIADRDSRQTSILFNQPVNTLGNNITGSPFAQPAQPSSISPNVNANLHLPQPTCDNNQGKEEPGTTNRLIAGLQQCFSQLYLHSLEIQSLNKHLQVLDKKEKPSPSHHRDFNEDQRSERPHMVPFDGGPKHRSSAMQDFKPNFSLPRFHAYNDAKHEEFPHRSFPNQIDNADGVDSNATHLRHDVDSLLEVSNPLYDRIPNNRASTWSVPSHAAGPSISNKNFFTPFNDRVPNDERRTKNDSYLSNSTDIPVDTDDIAENLPWAWQTESPHQVHNQQSTDILNNQVLPGTRANNYWDNFRSYSHQNPLSTAAKCNTGERHPTATSSTPGAQPLNGSSRMRSMGFENRQYNLTSGSNHTINKASDKNSSNTRSQNKGARSRYLHQTNSRRSTLSDSHLYNLVASPSDLQFRNDARKQNNQHSYGASNEQDFYNHGESSRSFGHITPDIENREATERDRGFRSQRSRNIDDNQDPNGDQFSQFLNFERINQASHEDLTNTEAYSHVVREAESLMQKHSHQPQFLLQLFHHASQITSNTDQHVALELLKELSNQRHQSNISNNRWNSNSSVTQSENLSTALSTTATGRNKYRNDARYPNKNSHITHGISGSESTEDGMSSEDDERERKENIGGQRHLAMMKNLAPNATGNGPSPINRGFSQNYDSPSKTSRLPGAPQLSLVPHNIMPLAATSKVVTGKDSANMACDITSHEKCKSENQSYVERFHRIKGDSDNSVRNFQPNYSREVSSPSFFQNSYELISHVTEEDISTHDGSLNLSRKRKSPRRDISVDGKNNFVLKNRQKNLNYKHPVSSQPIQQGPAGFESIVSAALREVLRVFEWPENNIASNIQVLETLHQSIMTQVELQSKSLGISSSFVSSVESQLKATLQGFQGKRISHVRQELAATITQVLIHQYCSLLVTQENSSDYIQPQTPDSNYSEFQSISNNTEADESFSSATSRHLNNQPCLNSLLSQPEGVVKQQKHSKPLWSYNPNIAGEFIHMNREEKMQLNKGTMAQGRDETKPNPINLSRGRGGAISKTSACSNLPNNNNDNFTTRSNVMGGSSPTSDASYPETSWMASRGATASNHAEGNINSSSHDSYNCAQRGRNGRESVDASEMLDLEQNDTEADQGDHARSKEFHNHLLPVHDLAEADQSQDVLDVECDSSVEDENQNAAVGAFSQPSQHQAQDSPVRLVTRKNLGPTSGLDEVPTRLLSGPDGASPPLGSSNINGRHPPEGLASSSETRNRPGSHNLVINSSQFSPPQNCSSPQHQLDGRHPPDGQNQVGQQQPAFHSSDSTGNAG